MQNIPWQFSNKNPNAADTFFTSDFYEINNNNSSQIEDFDISKQYLKSQFNDEKSMILRQYSKECFLKIIQIHNRFLFANSFKSWRNINEKQIQKQRLSPKFMTKAFLRVFYTLNKKIRTKVQKSLIKIINFTRQNEMRFYQPPIKKGVRRLQQWIDSMNAKYFYGNPIICQQMTGLGFLEIKRWVVVKSSKPKIEKLVQLIMKMSYNVQLQMFKQKLQNYIKTFQKLEILEGTLDLTINPIKRQCFMSLKTYFLLSNAKYMQNAFQNLLLQKSFQQSIIQQNRFSQNIEEQFFKLQQEKNKLIEQQLPINQKIEIQSTYQQKLESNLHQQLNLKDKRQSLLKLTSFQLLQAQQQVVKTCQQLIPSKKQEIYQHYFQGLNLKSFKQQKNIQKQKIEEESGSTLVKNQLKFSKQFKRKSSFSQNQKKSKLKFKSIPCGNLIKKINFNVQDYSEKHLALNQFKEKVYLKQANRQQQNQSFNDKERYIKQCIQKWNLQELRRKLKAIQTEIKFQKSLNFDKKFNRKITVNQKIKNLNFLKPQQIIISNPDPYIQDFFVNIVLQKLKQQSTKLVNNRQAQSPKKIRFHKQLKSDISQKVIKQQFLQKDNNQQVNQNSESKIHAFKFNFTLKQKQKNQKQQINMKKQSNVQKNMKLNETNHKSDLFVNSYKNLLNPTIQNRNQNYFSSKQIQTSKSQKIINFRNVQKVNSNSNSSKCQFKNQYCLVKNQNSNEKCLKFQPKLSKNKNKIIQKQESNPYINRTKYSQDIQNLGIIRSNSLAFKSKRPMKSVKSPKSGNSNELKHVLKKQRKKTVSKQKSERLNIGRLKKEKQIKSDYQEKNQKGFNSEYFSSTIGNTTSLSARQFKVNQYRNILDELKYSKQQYELANKNQPVRIATNK